MAKVAVLKELALAAKGTDENVAKSLSPWEQCLHHARFSFSLYNPRSFGFQGKYSKYYSPLYRQQLFTSYRIY